MTAVESFVCLFSLESTCDACNGSGSIENTRERRLTELTERQSKVLYHTDLERTKAVEGVEDEDTVRNNVPNVPNGNSLAGSAPNPQNMSVPNNPRP